MFRIFLVSCFFISLGIWVYAIDVVQIQTPSIPISPCVLPSLSGSVLRISEIWFDGIDERLEISNLWDIPFQDTLIISGAKSKPIILSNVLVLPWDVVIVGDSLTSFSWSSSIIASWQWLSIPDTTGFAISLSTPSMFLDSVSFSHDDIVSIPNDISLEAVFSWNERQRLRWNETSSTLSGVFANPGYVYCFDNAEVVTWDTPIPDVVQTSWSASDQVFSSWDLIEPTSSGDNIFDVVIDTGDLLSGSQSTTIWDSLSNSQLPSTWNTPSSPLISWINNDIVQTTVTNIVPYSWLQIVTDPPCGISEIHSIAWSLPEYIEILCQKSFSGTISFTWLWAGSTTKTIALSLHTGSYAILASDIDSFYDTGSVYVLPGISLLDAGETVIMHISGYNTLSYTYPSLTKTDSYYPLCISQSPCIWVPSPWFSYQYVAWYTTISPVSAVTYNPVNDSSDTTTNTYYQKLYQSWKAKAVQYEGEISSLKKTVSSLSSSIQKKSIVSKWSTTKVVTGVSMSQKSNTESQNDIDTAVKLTKNTKQTVAKKSSSSPKKSTTKSTTLSNASSSKTKKVNAKTISTTSKAYILLSDEHKLYKAYIAFLHTYLQNHLFAQYKTLKIPTLDLLLKKSLQAIKKQNYMYDIITWHAVSPFDFQAQRHSVTTEKSLDIAIKPLTVTMVSLYNSIPISLLEKLYAKYTLLSWNILSKNDI